jgi:hypothetical protein
MLKLLNASQGIPSLFTLFIEMESLVTELLSHRVNIYSVNIHPMTLQAEIDATLEEEQNQVSEMG